MKGSFFISEISVCDEAEYCDREHLEGQSCLPHGNQEAELRPIFQYPIQEGTRIVVLYRSSPKAIHQQPDNPPNI